MKLVLLLLLLCSFAFTSDSEWKLLHSNPFDSAMELSTIDANGCLYTADADGVITRYDSLGQKNLSFSPNQSVMPSFISAWNPNQVFVFYQELQEWVILSRFLTQIERYRISEEITDETIGFVHIVAPALDNTIWFFDESDLSLKHYDLLGKYLISQTPLNLLLQDQDVMLENGVSFLQVYQGQLFLGIKEEGVLFFDSFGSFKKKLSYPKWKSLSFYKEKLIIGFEDKQVRYDLYSGKSEELKAPVKEVERGGNQIWEASFCVLSKCYWLNKHENRIYVRY